MSDDQILTPRVIDVRGTHYQMGFQHGQQVRTLLPAIHAAIEARFAQLAGDRPGDAFEATVNETVAILEAHDPATLALVRGLADGLGLDYARLLRYNLITFLRDILVTRNALAAGSGLRDDGCSTWAATGAATVDGQPIMAKNRDFSLLHLPLQTVVRAQPEHGYRYITITSAGSPGVFVAGINEAGLALVDTHVSSTDVGPGLPTFALSMHVLEEHGSVRSALDYLKSMPRLGRNNVLLADARGDIALFEIGNRHFAIREADSGLLVNTNHFTCDEMVPFYVDTDAAAVRGNSHKRYDFMTQQLKHAHGKIDLAFAQNLMSSHADRLSSICRHPTPDETTSTISASIFLPGQKRMLFCHGFPCSRAYIELDQNRGR
jgi:isopenicillin-N N-acyltransferase-like protein